jgi:formylglycine-generating enzyme required for sulfatase activity
MSQSGLVTGTPLYMAPEQARGESVDHRADLFSLGSVLYTMCTREPAFRAKHTLAVLKRVCDDTPRPISELNPKVPGWLVSIVMKLLAKDPAARFQSALEVAEALQRKKAPPPVGARPARRRRLAALGLALGLAGALVVGLLVAQRGLNDDGPLPPTFTNGIGMDFVLVPRGKFWMGGSAGRPGTKEVQIGRDFYLGTYEVTQHEWQTIMNGNPSGFSRKGDKRDAVQDVADADLQRFPAEMMTWDDTQQFLLELNRRENKAGWLYRLPSEAEWEYACRGGPETDPSESAFDFYCQQPTNTLLPELANYWHPSCLKRTSKVGSFPPNRLGLYDMHGNVNEMCNDMDGPVHHVHRGGCWEFSARHCRAAARDALPGHHIHDSLGLRVALVRDP